jgi:DNA polymerase III epsilon subunit-like protein
MIKWYLCDVETTGLSASLHEITEISIIEYDTRTQLTLFVKCEHPESASIDALNITHKTLEDLSKGDDKEVAVEKLTSFIERDGLTPAHRCGIYHNASFDIRFLHALYDKVGKRFPIDLSACSMTMTRSYAKSIGIVKPKVNLAAACELLGVKMLEGAHASKVDTRNTYKLWKALTEKKNVDYLPFIKTSSHIIKGKEIIEENDIFDEID